MLPNIANVKKIANRRNCITRLLGFFSECTNKRYPTSFFPFLGIFLLFVGLCAGIVWLGGKRSSRENMYSYEEEKKYVKITGIVSIIFLSLSLICVLIIHPMNAIGNCVKKYIEKSYVFTIEKTATELPNEQGNSIV